MMRTPLLACLLIASLLQVTSAAPVADFSRYQVILDRKPFGDAPPPEAAATPPPVVNPADSFAKMIRMSALVEVEGGGKRVGLIDMSNNESFFLGEGEIINGVELVSADWDEEEAVLRKGAEMAIIKLQSGEIQALTPDQQKARLKKPKAVNAARRLSYAERRRQRQAQRRTPPPKPKPPAPSKYTGDELTQHLQDYQMEVIRQGLPPLPIPLTPEMDAQLVSEGVLPAQ